MRWKMGLNRFRSKSFKKLCKSENQWTLSQGRTMQSAVQHHHPCSDGIGVTIRQTPTWSLFSASARNAHVITCHFVTQITCHTLDPGSLSLLTPNGGLHLIFMVTPIAHHLGPTIRILPLHGLLKSLFFSPSPYLSNS